MSKQFFEMNPFDPCKNCGLGIHPEFKKCPFCDTEDPLNNRICCICLDTIKEIDKHILNCKHFLHKNCYISMLKSCHSKKCPICRQKILTEKQECGICQKTLNMDESSCETFRSLNCFCCFHYSCIKKHKFVECLNCNIQIDCENIEALSYLYLQNGYEKWIGNIPKCKKEDCGNRANPKRFGYCCLHKDKMCTNRAIILAFVYFTRYINEPIEKNRQNIFEKLVEFCDKHYNCIDYTEVNFEKFKADFENYLLILA